MRTFRVLIPLTRIICRDDSPQIQRIYREIVPSTDAVHRIFAARRGTATLLDAAIAALALAGTLAQLRHGGVFPTRPGSGQLDSTGWALAACSTLPLVAWRWSPLGILLVTAFSSVLLAGLGYPIDLILGPAAALFLLAASREPAAPWTRRTTATVVGLLAAYLIASGIAQPGFPGIELLHTGLA
jgi:hypothetical protein